MDKDWKPNQPKTIKLVQSIALVRKIDNSRHQWLAVWQKAKGQFEFIRAPRLEKESFRETCRREVGWVLDLDPSTDFLVASTAQLNLEFVARIPPDDISSHVAVSFFLVDIYRKLAMRKVDSNASLRWLTSREVCRAKTTEHQPVDSQLVYLINRGRVINPWD